MKKLFVLFIALFLFLAVVPSATKASKLTYENFYYEISTTKDKSQFITITGVVKTGEVGHLVIPSTINGLSVKAIADEAFVNFNSEFKTYAPTLIMKKVTLPATLETIGTFAFAFNEIEEISLPDSLKKLGDSAFAMNNLKHISIPSFVETIGADAFSGNLIEKVVIPKSVKEYGHPISDQVQRIEFLGAVQSVKQNYDNVFETWSVEINGVPKYRWHGKVDKALTIRNIDMKRYPDLVGHWAEQDVNELTLANVIGGYPDGKFRPSEKIMRKQVASMIVKAFELEPKVHFVPFNDVATSHPNFEAIKKLKEANIIHGSNNYFMPNDSLTRAHAAKILVLASGIPLEKPTTEFKDVSLKNANNQYIATLHAHGIVSGVNGNYMPNAPVTRAQFASMLAKLNKALNQ